MLTGGRSEMAAARMVLLAIVVLLFAAAWSGDRPQGPHAVAAHRRQKGPTASSAAVSPSVRPAALCSANEPLPLDWQAALPCGIAKGEFQLVETSGRTQRVVLTGELLQSLGHDPDVRAESLYTLQQGGRTAYLIRIEQPERIASEHRAFH